MVRNFLYLNAETLAFATFKDLWQTFKRVVRNINNYDAGVAFLLKNMTDHFSQEFKIIDEFTFVDTDKDVKKDKFTIALNNSYKSYKEHLIALIHQRTLIENASADQFFNVKKCINVIKNTPIRPVLIDKLFDNARNGILKKHFTSSFVDSIRNLIVKKNHYLKLVEKKKWFDEECKRYMKFEYSLIRAETIFVAKLQEYMSFSKTIKKSMYNMNYEQYQNLKHKLPHILSSSDVIHLNHQLGNAMRSIHQMSQDYFILLEIIWNYVFDLNVNNSFWAYIDSGINHYTSNDIFDGRDYMLYALFFLDPTLIREYLLTKLAGDEKTDRSDDILIRRLNMIKNSNDIKQYISDFLYLVNLLRLYRSIIRELFDLSVKSDKEYDHFKKIFHTPIHQFIGFESYIKELGLSSMLNTETVLGDVYRFVLHRILNQIDILSSKFKFLN